MRAVSFLPRSAPAATSPAFIRAAGRIPSSRIQNTEPGSSRCAAKVTRYKQAANDGRCRVTNPGPPSSTARFGRTERPIRLFVGLKCAGSLNGAPQEYYTKQRKKFLPAASDWSGTNPRCSAANRKHSIAQKIKKHIAIALQSRWWRYCQVLPEFPWKKQGVAANPKPHAKCATRPAAQKALQ